MGRRLDPVVAVAIMRAAGLEPLEPYPGSNAPWKCICLACGDECAPSLSHVREGSGCRRCGHERGARKQRGDPGQAAAEMRAAGLEPSEPYPGVNIPWKCTCLVCGDECAPRLGHVRSRGGGCFRCGRERGSLKQRTQPEEAAAEMRAVGAEPLEPYPGLANSPWKCQCLVCGAVISPSLTRVRGGGGVCRERCRVEKIKAAQRLDEGTARQVMLDAGLEPLELYTNSGTGWRCRCCRCGSEVTPTIDSVRRGRGCAVCALASRAEKLRTPEDKAIASMVSGGYEPLEPYPGVKDKPWRCRCTTCGREGAPTLGNTRQGKRCPWCARNRVSPDEAVAVMRSLGAEPLEPYPGAHAPWRCRCNKCGNEISPTYSNARKFTPCRYCAPFGFRYQDPAAVYLLRHSRYQALKIGVASEVSKYDRIGHHAGNGWKLEGNWVVPTGAHAAAVEQKILRWWRQEIGAPIALSHKEMPQGGWTETASHSYVGVSATKVRIEELTAEFTQQPTSELPPLDPEYPPVIDEESFPMPTAPED